MHSIKNAIEYMIAASILDYHRFMHMDSLRKNQIASSNFRFLK